MTKTIAFCYASGHIGFGPITPRGALPLASGPDEKVREFITGFARLSYDNETWLVPGVPEAESQMAGLDVVLAFRDQIRPAAQKVGLTV